MRRFFVMSLFGLAVVVVLSACGHADFVAGSAGSAQPSPLQTAGVTLSGPVPPTATAILPPDYKTPTPIPPEHQHFFIAMGNGGLGVPAIQPHEIVSGAKTTGITRADVEPYVTTHQMRGDMVSISYQGTSPVVKSIERVPLAEVYSRFMPGSEGESWRNPYPPETRVFLVELSGTFRFSGGPYPGDRGTYREGVWVFDEQTGYDLLEGAVGRIDTP